jgi:hypothetical protein
MTETCKHEKKELVWTEVGTDGRPIATRTLRFQCPDCGCLFGSSAPMHMANKDTPDVDMVSLGMYLQGKDDFYQYRRVKLREEAEHRRREWLENSHSPYLQTDAWRDKRAKVMRRANWICEGCGVNKASQVHHLTYDHHGNEFLFELVAICTPCHERIHDHDNRE